MKIYTEAVYKHNNKGEVVLLKRLKDKLYYYFAEKNWGVRREYGPYVDAHQKEHRKQPWKHWWLLIRLNWHYRIKRSSKLLIKKNVDIVPTKELHYPESQAFSRDTVDKAVEQLSKFDIVSFDIFDTLVFRPFEEPKDLFTILAVEMNKSDFKEIRVKTEREARRITTKPNKEINIYDIYELLGSRYSIDSEKWMAREIQLEKEFCYANPFMLEVYEKLLMLDKKIVATSDMYLPSNIIKDILYNCGYSDITDIFVSCDFCCNKKNGELQKIVENTMGRYKRYIHVGDNFNSDIKASKNIGWDAYYYQNINERGKDYRHKYSKSLVRSTYAGIVNAFLHATNEERNPHFEHGFINGGILLCGYCEWLNELAKKQNIDKFIFVSRDGDIVSKVYKRYYNEVSNDYILASRFALYQTDFENHIDEFILDNIKKRVNAYTKGKTVKQLLDETDLDCLIEYLPEFGLSLESKITKKIFLPLQDMIFEKKEVISDYYRIHREAVQNYLKEIVRGHKNICIVDVGWKGTCTQILTDLITDIDPETNVFGAFVGTILHPSVESKLINENVFAYLFSSNHNRDLMHQEGNGMLNVLVEFMFSAPTPSLIGYELEDDELLFSFSSFAENNYRITREIQKGILAFSEEYNRVTKNFKNIFRISPYDAFGPLKSTEMLYSYNYDLFKNFQENLLPGRIENDSTTFGEIMKNKN